jgi:hypothetical protein
MHYPTDTPDNHTDPRTPWPPTDAYTVAHKCPTCIAEPGEPCTIRARQGTRNGERRFHVARADRGARRFRRDRAKAPWPEDRVPGKRYDSLGSAWTPEVER